MVGIPRDSSYAPDVLYDGGGKHLEMIITDTVGYRDIVFGLLTLTVLALLVRHDRLRARATDQPIQGRPPVVDTVGQCS